MDRLQAIEFELVDMESEEQKETFTIENIEHLSWAFRKMKSLKEQKHDIDSIADIEINRINHWRNTEAAKLENGLSYFESLILLYAMKKKGVDPAFKSESTPYGKVKYVKQREKWIYDEQALVKCLFEADRTDLIKTEHTPRKDEIKRQVKVRGNYVYDIETGDQLVGITVEQMPEKIEIKPE